jgi:acyl-lipid omega-6 desaturase (Delta-12 desaturase)
MKMKMEMERIPVTAVAAHKCAAQSPRSRTSTDPPSSMRDQSKRSWREIVAPYARPDTRRAVIQLLDTGLPFLVLVAALLYGIGRYRWAAFPLVVPAAALLVRLFMIQHDCGHGSFFKSRLANDLLGRTLGVLTLTPYAFWRSSHATHHATSGNLDRRGVGDVITLTVREYRLLPAWRRLFYQIYRHPLVLFGIGPTYLFVIRHRIPTGNPLRHRQRWTSILGTDAVIAATILLLVLTVGPRAVLLGYLPMILLASSLGVWLFYIQHQFEDTYWQAEAEWDFGAAALQGSSFYDLPRALHWLTGYIGFHHIHHLCSKVPNYRLRACFEQNSEFWQAKRLTLFDSLRCPRLALWDEEQRILVSFRDATGRRAVAPAPTLDQWADMASSVTFVRSR